MSCMSCMITQSWCICMPGRLPAPLTDLKALLLLSSEIQGTSLWVCQKIYVSRPTSPLMPLMHGRLSSILWNCTLWATLIGTYLPCDCFTCSFGYYKHRDPQKGTIIKKWSSQWCECCWLKDRPTLLDSEYSRTLLFTSELVGSFSLRFSCWYHTKSVTWADHCFAKSKKPCLWKRSVLQRSMTGHRPYDSKFADRLTHCFLVSRPPFFTESWTGNASVSQQNR